ncbi:MAG: hypothetical protein K9N36_07725 [Candidatus Marinimicrobia bacterium]|nr:hypothetical protein [Candidatus Neomarinimicrobiota bacterium]
MTRFFRLSLIVMTTILIVGCGNKIDSVNGLPNKLQNVKQLTHEGDNGEAYWSPDGEKIIFQSKRDGRGCDQIYIMNADGSDQHMVSNGLGACTCAYFTSDMSRIVFASTFGVIDSCPPRPPSRPGKYIWPQFPYEIYSANPDGSDLRKIRENPGYDAEPTICFANNRVIFTSQVDEDLELFSMNADGSDVQRITHRLGYDGGAYFSPNGKEIVWRAWYPENHSDSLRWINNMKESLVEAVPLDVYVMNADGTNIRRLTQNGATNWAPSWHPGGEYIIFSSNMDDWRREYAGYGHNFELYLIKKDGTGLTRLTFNKTFDSFPMFSPDGKKVAFASNRDAQNPRATHVYVADWVE